MQRTSKTKTNRFIQDRIAIFALFFAMSYLASAFSVSAGIALNKSVSSPINNLGLVGYWTFDGPNMVTNVRDTSGQGNNGYLSGQISTTTVSGKVGQAISFDGVDDVVIVPMSSSLDIPTTVTACAWIRPTNLPPSEAIMLSNANLDTDFTSQYSFEYEADGSVALFWSPGSGNFFYIGSSDPAITTLNVWYHLCVVRNSSSSGSAYVNGSPVITSVNSGAIPTSGFGDFTFMSGKGPTDEVRLYNRALGASEITQLYKSGSAKVSKSQSTIDSSLLAWWTFDGPDMTINVRDKSGRGNHGHLVGFTSTTTVPGKIGQALDFRIVDDAVDVGDPSSLNISGIGTGLTVSAWIKRGPSDLNDNIVSRGLTGNSAALESYHLAMADDTQVRFRISDGTTRFSSVGNVPRDIWTHITGVYNGASTTILYINGVQVDTDTDASFLGLNTSASNISIGDDQSGSGEDYTGAIDDVRIHNRALSATEVFKLYQTGIQTTNKSSGGGDSLTSGLVGWWTFDGKDTPWSSASAGTSVDKSGNGNTATMQSMSQTTSPVVGKTGQALSFNGSSSYVSTATQFSNPQVFTISAWFKTTTAGGKIIGFEDVQTGTSGASYDRHLYMGTNGNVYFGWYPGTVTVVASGVVLNDGKWHHAVGTHNGTLGTLYIDGVSRGTNAGGSQAFSGYWRVGSYKLNSWTNGADGYFNGSIDDARVYNRTLSLSEVKALYNLGR